MAKGDQWGPIVQDAEFDCPDCHKHIRCRLTVYSDVTYVTCSQGHHNSYSTPGMVPNCSVYISPPPHNDEDDVKPDEKPRGRK